MKEAKHYQKNKMGNVESAGIRIANETSVSLVYVISQLGPLYWGVIQPGERVSRHTGRVWFTVETYPYDGRNEPSTWDAVCGPLLATITSIVVVATAGTAAAAVSPATGSLAAALAPIVTSPAVTGFAAGLIAAGEYGAMAYGLKKELEKKLTDTLNRVVKHGHYANGDWIHVRGGPKENIDFRMWKKMRFEG